MDFNLSEQHLMLQSSIRNFAAKEVWPSPKRLMPKTSGPRDVAEIGNLGIMGITVNERIRGAGADLLSAVLVLEELSKASPSIALPGEPTQISAPTT